MAKKESEFYGDHFKKQADKNRKLSLWFGIGGFVFSIAAAWFSYCFLRFDQNIVASSFTELLIKGDVINKVFIFSIMLIIISILKREYLALRHQFTLNTHRQNSLNSHKEILHSIQKTATGSDKEISNAVLLELTKAMFNSGDTGFVRNSSASSDSRVVEISKSLFKNNKE